jgi:monoamine oxidase
MAMVDMGLLNKVVLRFDKCFWPQDASLFLSTPCPTTQCTWFLNLVETGCPILVGFVGGHAAHKLEHEHDDVVIDRALADLNRIFQTKDKSLVGPQIITRWGSDPFAYGSYSRFRAGALGHERRLLSQPILGTLFLAGEATHTNDPSTLHGAYWSGKRAARQIAGT